MTRVEHFVFEIFVSSNEILNATQYTLIISVELCESYWNLTGDKLAQNQISILAERKLSKE